MEILFIFLWILLGLWGAYVAGNRNRSQVAWGILSAIFGVLAILLVALLPALEEKKVKRTIKRKK